MKEGTAGGVATLGLMRKFDYVVMMKGYQFLQKLGPGAISARSVRLEGIDFVSNMCSTVPHDCDTF